MYLLVICNIFFIDMSVQVVRTFLILLTHIMGPSIFWIQEFFQIYVLQTFFSVCNLSFLKDLF